MNPDDPALGQLLLRRGMLAEDQLRIALHEQGKTRQPLGRQLVQLGFVSEATLRDALGEHLGKASIDLSHTAVAPEALARVPVELARRHRLLPLAYDAGTRRLTLAVADAHDFSGLDRLRALDDAPLHLDTLIAGESEIEQAIDRCYGHTLSIDGILQEIETGVPPTGPAEATEHRPPVVRLVDALLADAVKANASDIHFEPENGFLRIRYRLDGLLCQIRALHHAYWPAMAVRLKVMAGMNIAETRAPQDGHIAFCVSGRPIDFRVASQPTLHGENIVLRVLDRQKGIVPLDRLGLNAAELAGLQRMVARPEGLILVTGPTGSGKTTTLYSLLAHINSEQIHIMTLEDPVEYPLPLLRQTSVADAVKLDFANGIRSMMRQDPDVILVGEIRDAETARMALGAAMTGHQVYATLHSNSALGAVFRLSDLGLSADQLSGNLIGIVAQRLLRRLCPHCKRRRAATPAECRLLGLPATAPTPEIAEAVGCAACRGRAYAGRMAIMEWLCIDAELDELVAERAPRHVWRQTLTRRAFCDLATSGCAQVLAGHTTLAELRRVVDLDARQ